MKTARITACRIELPSHEGRCTWSAGKSADVSDATVVRGDTDGGVTGRGEVRALDPFFPPAYASGARSGVAALAPYLLGDDPTRLGPTNRRLNRALEGRVPGGEPRICVTAPLFSSYPYASDKIPANQTSRPNNRVYP